MRSFLEISNEKGSDKASRHGFDACYEAHFSSLRDMEISILEIGIQAGASLRLWEEYFPKARIFGIDKEAVCKSHETERSRVFIGMQEDGEFLQSVTDETGELDIVIDDGGHHMWQQQASFSKLLPHVRSGGLYVIEDLETSYQPPFEGGPPGYPGTTVAMVKSLMDDLNIPYHWRQPQAPASIQSIHLYKNIAFFVRS